MELKMRNLIILMTIWILTAGMAAWAASVPQAEGKLLITLKQDVIVDKNQVCLGQIATLTGPQELVEKANNVGLGTLTAKGQSLYADRKTVLSRLASTGILPQQVELSGPEITKIHKNDKCVESAQIVEIAKVYLAKQLAGQKIGSIGPVGMLSAVVLNDPNLAPQLSAAMSRYQTPGTRKITVSVSQGGIPVAQREVVFAVQYQVRRVIAQRELLPGTVIQPSDVKIEQVEASTPEPANWKEPFGLVVRRRILENTQISPEWMESTQAPNLIRRNQQVMVMLNTGAMSLSAPGQAMDDGRVGQLIRVKRGQQPDERIIYCTIQSDGTVRPQI
jgi:flagella basal body P-ring formation protein FlgA